MRAKTVALVLVAIGLQLNTAAAEPPHNVILFVPDGLRALKVTPETAPAMAAPSRCFTANSSSGDKTSVLRP